MLKRKASAILCLLTLVAAHAAAAERLPFDVAAVGLHELSRERVLEGIVEAVKESTVSAETSGRIAEINFDVGDYVPKGSVILRIRSKQQRAQVARAEADVREARARYAEATKDFRRVGDLYANDLVPKAQFDAAKAALDATKARLEATQAALEQVREQREYTVIRAPYAGIVTARHVEVGETANPGQPLMSGFSLDELRVRVDVPQQLVNTIRERRAARVFLPEARHESIDAQDIAVFPYAAEGSNTFTVRVRLPVGIKHLLPGMLVKVAFETGRHKRLLVPKTAVVYRSEVVGVYVVNPDASVRFRQIRPGHEIAEDMIEVLAGLEAGEKIALDPLRAGVYLKETTPGNLGE